MYESGNENEITDENNTIEIINEKLEQDKLAVLQRENQTLKQMVENRNQEIQNKPVENSEDKILALSNVLGINKMKEQIDELNNGQNQIIGKLSEVINSMNVISQSINGGHVNQAASPEDMSNPLAKLDLLSGVIDKATQLYSVYKQNKEPIAQAPLIDQNFINQRMVDSFMEDLDTGKSISTFIKNSLKKTATKNIVNTALKDIGHDTDEPA